MSDVKDFVHGERPLVYLAGALGSLSTISVTLLLLHIFSVAIVPLLTFGRRSLDYGKEERIFLRMHLGVFVVCLLCSDLIQGISGVMQLTWASENRVRQGPLCTVQAVLILFGDNGTAVWNAVVSGHTFWTVVLGKRMSSAGVTITVVLGWLLTAFLTFIGPLALEDDRGPFYGIAGAWCFVTGKYKVHRILVHYLPMLISAFIITILYLVVALVLSGFLVRERKGWRFRRPIKRHEHRDPNSSGASGWFTLWFIPKFSWSALKHQENSSSNNASNSSRGGGATASTGGTGRVTTETMEMINKDVDGGIGEAPSPTHIKQTSKSRVNFSPLRSAKTSRSLHRVQPSIEQAQPTQQAQPTTRSEGRTNGGGGGNSSHNHLRALAIKMLWYPIVYIALIMPITVARISLTLYVGPKPMLVFMCFLWSMGTANVIIYCTTRRVGRSPLLHRDLSRSRSRSKSGHRLERGNTTYRTYNTHAPERSVQILIDVQTRQEIDEPVTTNVVLPLHPPPKAYDDYSYNRRALSVEPTKALPQSFIDPLESSPYTPVKPEGNVGNWSPVSDDFEDIKSNPDHL